MGAPLAAGRTGNRFFDGMPAAARTALLPLCTRTQLENGRIIYDPDEPMTEVYFPVDSVLSVVLHMSDNEIAEVGIIGCEGMSGLSIALGQSSSNQRTVVQIPGFADHVSADAFRDVLEKIPDLKAFALRYAQATIMASAQLTACNTLHPTVERCARWLLMAHDRVGGDLLLLTQGFLSQMLGVRRGGVTIAASALQEAGFISYSRGHITVRSRLGLESASCECYESVQRHWKKVMGYYIGDEAEDGSDRLTEHTSRTDGARQDGRMSNAASLGRAIGKSLVN